jgi:nitroreductase
MKLRELILSNRSYRRFLQLPAPTRDLLQQWVDLARLSASSNNRQPLKFFLCCDPADNDRVFPHLAWAGYLAEWPGPKEQERPTSYVIILGDSELSQSFGYDCGIAAQTILLGAVEMGFGGCIIGSIQREELRKVLDIPSRYEILLVLALGKPGEKVVIEEIGSTGDIKYWRDDAGVHHVPKRSLEEILLA